MRLLASAAVCFVWSFDPLGRWREWLAHTLLENHRLVLVSYGLVHHGTIPIARNVSLQALMRTTPTHLANLGGGQLPIGKSIECRPKGRHCAMVNDIDERVAEVGISNEVTRQVDKVIETHETVLIQHSEEHVSGVIVWNVFEHDSGAAIARRALGLRWQRQLIFDWLHSVCLQHILSGIF